MKTEWQTNYDERFKNVFEKLQISQLEQLRTILYRVHIGSQQIEAHKQSRNILHMSKLDSELT